MSIILLDTGPVIQQLRHKQPTVLLLREIGRTTELAISVITRSEIRAGMQPHERYLTQKLLARFTTFDVNRNIADRAGDILARLKQNEVSFAMADALIAATAIIYHAPLLTFNTKHFQSVSGLQLYSVE